MPPKRRQATPEEEKFFADERTRFTAMGKYSLLISNAIGRQFVDERRGIATWLFMRACVTSITIEGLFNPKEAGYGAKYLDHASIASLARALIENISVMLYVGDISISEDEWKCRRYLIDLHDCCNRIAFLKMLGPQKPQEKAIKALTDRLHKNSYFKTIPEKRQKRLLAGEDMYISGRHAAMLKLGWGEDITRGVYKYLSNHAHSLPMSFHRTELNSVYQQDSPAAKVAAGFATEFARKALGLGCMHMIALFPYVEAKFDPAILAALKLEYASETKHEQAEGLLAH
jgi:hypothetical protein